MLHNLTEILDEKSKNELQVIAKNIDLKGYSRLSKAKLITKLLTDKNKLKAEIGLSPYKFIENQWFIGIVIGLIFLILPFVIAPLFSKKDASKEDINTIIKKIDKNEQYSQEIEFLEKYKEKFLQEGMDIHYKVFGVKNGVLVTTSELKNSIFKTNYKSKFIIDIKNNLVEVGIIAKELSLHSPNTSKSFLFINSFISESFPIIEDEFFDFTRIVTDSNYIMRFVLLKKDYEQPIFAIGMGKKKQVSILKKPRYSYLDSLKKN